MQCDVCDKKKATVHLTEIIDEQMKELHLCEECAREKSVQMEQQFGLADLLAGLADFGKQVKEFDATDQKCPNCGLAYDDFRKFGRLGCSECYKAFNNQLSALLKKIHGSSQHLGKIPLNAVVEKPKAKKRKATQSTKKAKVNTVDTLKQDLQDAIKRENFEEAAEIRDKIRMLEQKEKAKGKSK